MRIQERQIRGERYFIARWVEPSGKHRSKSFSAKKFGPREAKRLANEHLAEQEKRLHTGTYVSPTVSRITVGELVAGWGAQAQTVGTRGTRRQLAQNLGDLEYMRLDAVGAAHIRVWVGFLQEGRPWADGTPLAPTTVRLFLNLLRSAFNQGVSDGLLVQNPASKVRVKNSGGRVMFSDIPTPEQVRAIIAHCTPARGVSDYQVALQLMAVTGMRVSEVAGLTWACVDFDECKIRVVQQTLKSDRYVLTPLKTGDSGVRSLSVDADTMGLLAELRAQDHVGDGRVFHVCRRPFTSYTVGRQVRKVVDELGLPASITAKSFRHFHATTLLSAGVSVKTVQYRMGHSTAMQTLDTYGHFVPQDDVSAGVLIGGVVWGKSGEKPRHLGVV